MRKNLANIANTTTNLFEANIDFVNNAKSKKEIEEFVKNLFEENNLKSESCKRILSNISRAKSLTDAQFVIYNSILSGENLETIKASKR